MTTWTLSGTLLAQERIGGSDTAAYGGDLAYLYAQQGSLAGIDLVSAQDVIADNGFGTTAQELLEPVMLAGLPQLV